MSYQHLKEYVEAMALAEQARKEVAEKRFDEAGDLYCEAMFLLIDAKKAKSATDEEKQALGNEFTKLSDELVYGPVGQYGEEQIAKDIAENQAAAAVDLEKMLAKSAEYKMKIIYESATNEEKEVLKTEFDKMSIDAENGALKQYNTDEAAALKTNLAQANVFKKKLDAKMNEAA